MSNNKWTVVVPTIRETQLKEFLDSFKDLFKQHVQALIIVEDNPKKTFDIPDLGLEYQAHVSWEDIDKELKEDAWIIPRRTDCIRSFGFYMAQKFTNSPFILTLDDDVRYNGVDIFTSYENGFKQKQNNAIMYNTLGPFNIYPRGFPFKDRKQVPVMLQWGMWEGVPDLDGVTQLQYPIDDYKVPLHYKIVRPMYVLSKGEGVTGCIMNCAFKREVIPSMYQLLMGQDDKGNKHPYDRWGDIWSGHLAKRYIEDVLGGCVGINYDATIRHARASNVYMNIQKELSGYAVNEKFWDVLRNIGHLKSYEDIAIESGLADLYGSSEVSAKYMEAMLIWSRILKQ